MSDKLQITRRDFMNGVALGVAAGLSLSPVELLAMGRKKGVSYPPALTGMRGNHPGSFEVAHALSRYGATWPRPAQRTDGIYDLVVVGGGISGLSAALFFQQRAGPEAKVLVLDNHDDFGGHAKRNEFNVDGRRLIGYGGSQSIDTPGRYSSVAKRLLKDLSIHTERFYEYFDEEYFQRRGLGRGVYFSEEAYGIDSVHPNVTSIFGDAGIADAGSAVDGYPLTRESRKSLLRLLTEDADYLEGLGRAEKIQGVARGQLYGFSQRTGGCHPGSDDPVQGCHHGILGSRLGCAVRIGSLSSRHAGHRRPRHRQARERSAPAR